MTGMEPIWIGAAAKGLTDIVVKPVSEVLNRRLDEPFQQLLFNVFGRYIQASFHRHDLQLDRTQIEDLLFHQRLLLLMDGLNELPSEKARLNVAKF
jgi:hypothetical protein